MKFPYIQYDISGRLRPIIPIRVELDGQSLRYDVLIDSGADINVFDLAVAQALGIDVESGERSSLAGVTGSVQDFFFHDVTLRIGSHRVDTRAGFADLPGRTYGVVGQTGFFSFFRVMFSLPQNYVEVTRAR